MTEPVRPRNLACWFADRGHRAGPVTARTAGRLAWSLWGVAMALEVAGILLWLPNHAELVDRFGTIQDIIPHVFLVPGYATVGAVIAARLPQPGRLAVPGLRADRAPS